VARPLPGKLLPHLCRTTYRTEEILTPLSLLKQYLGIDPLDTSQDVALQEYIDRSQAIIEEYLGRALDEQAYTQKFDVPGPHMKIRHWPIKPDSVTRIQLDGVIQTLSDFRIYEETGLIKKQINWCITPMSQCYAEVDYTGGYDPLPQWAIEAIANTALEVKAVTEAGQGATVAAGAVKKEVVHGIVTYEYFSGDSRDSASSGSFFLIPAITREWLDLRKDRVLEG